MASAFTLAAVFDLCALLVILLVIGSPAARRPATVTE